MELSTPNHTLSVLIIVKGRQDHLRNVIRGLEASTYLPNEIVVVHMNEPPYELSSALPIKQFVIRSNEPLPLAAARNHAASSANNEHLLFLDVDCIPSKTCIAELMRAESAVITMADPQYLSHPVTELDFEQLGQDSKPSPVRHDLAYGVSNRYEFFWSLGFLISKQTFQRIGGFDESFKGYGGEDTDFAFSARAKKVPLVYSRAKVYHQPHPSYDPPLNWLKDIVENARVFFDKWKVWPMEGWLRNFAESGYISFDSKTIQILKLPTDDEIRYAQRE